MYVRIKDKIDILSVLYEICWYKDLFGTGVIFEVSDYDDNNYKLYNCEYYISKDFCEIIEFHGNKISKEFANKLIDEIAIVGFDCSRTVNRGLTIENWKSAGYIFQSTKEELKEKIKNETNKNKKMKLQEELIKLLEDK